MTEGAVPAGFDLTPEHYRVLHDESAISDSLIQSAGIRSIRSDQVHELQSLGFSEKQQVPGILFPHLTVWPNDDGTGQRIVGYSLRRDEPAMDGKGKPNRKYEIPYGQQATIYVPPTTFALLNDPNVTLYGTEGIKKSLSLAAAGVATISFGGVWSWRGKNAKGGKTSLPDLHEIAWNGRTVPIVFDNDVMIKMQVRSALDELTSVLRARGALIHWVLLPDAETRKVGVDDFLRENDGDAKKLALYTYDAAAIQAEDPFITLPLTDVGNAERFAYFFQKRAVWCAEIKTWFCWKKNHWDGKPSEEIIRKAIETVREMQDRAEHLPMSVANRDALIKYARSLEKRSKLMDMIELAKARLEVEYSQFDRDAHLLNCPNGTVDLTTGELKPHDPDDYITKVAGHDYIPGARHSDWDHFITDSCAGKEGLEEFLQQAVGYSATGLTIEEKLFMVIGPTRTGKSTFLEAIKVALGDYGVTANFETFLKNRNGGGDGAPSEGLARLAGARFVSSNEVDEGRSLAIATVKQLTGGDKITARFLYKGSFEFSPRFALWLVANTEPLVPQDEAAMWERVLRVPLDNEVPADQRDLTLKARLQSGEDAGPAVLSWIVEGAVKWYAAKKLLVPTCVTFSTNEYRERMDPLSDFLEAVCVEGPHESVGTLEMQAAYVSWAKQVGEKVPLGRTALSKSLTNRGFEKVQTTGGAREWRKVGLQQHVDSGSGVFTADFGGTN